jgi:hypothetical protein
MGSAHARFCPSGPILIQQRRTRATIRTRSGRPTALESCSTAIERNKDIYVMHADGSGVRRVTYDGAADTQPAV